MFEFITNTEERGQVGIGTLIVFIAMVLVAAIAAGVLINTAGFLQTQAEATGQDSTDLVSERIDVSSSVGIVESASDGILEQVRLTTSGAPGASDIDLADTTIQAVGPGGQQNLVFAAGGVADNDVTAPGGTDEFNVPAEIDEVSDTLEVGVGDLDTGSSYQLSIDGGTVTQSVDPGTENQSVVEVDVSSLEISEGDQVSVEFTKDTNPIGGGTKNVDVVSAADSAVTAPSGETDTIDTPAEVDEDATEIDVGVSDTITDGTDIEVTDGDTTETVTFTTPDDEGSVVTVSLGAIDPAEVDSLDVTLVDTSGNPLDSGTTTVIDSVETVDDLRADEFAVEDNGDYMQTPVLGNQDQYTVVLNPTVGALENTQNTNNAFGQSDSATLDLVSPAGATTQVELRAPDLFNEDGEAVRL